MTYKSPYDCGSADAYYWRHPDPHWYPEGNVTGPRGTDMTDEQVADYYRGYEEEEDRKEWE
jgi:hypothetical protein